MNVNVKMMNNTKFDLLKKSVPKTRFLIVSAHKITNKKNERKDYWYRSFNENGYDFVILDVLRSYENLSKAIETLTDFEISRYLQLRNKFGYSVEEYRKFKTDQFDCFKLISGNDFDKINKNQFYIKNGKKYNMFGKLLKDQDRKAVIFFSVHKQKNEDFD